MRKTLVLLFFWVWTKTYLWVADKINKVRVFFGGGKRL